MNGCVFLHICNYLQAHHDDSHYHFFYLWFGACVTDAIINILVMLDINCNGLLFLADFKNEMLFVTQSMVKMIQILLILHVFGLGHNPKFVVLTTSIEVGNLMMKMYYHDLNVAASYRRTYKYQPKPKLTFQQIFPRISKNASILITFFLCVIVGTPQNGYRMFSFAAVVMVQSISEYFNTSDELSKLVLISMFSVWFEEKKNVTKFVFLM